MELNRMEIRGDQHRMEEIKQDDTEHGIQQDSDATQSPESTLNCMV